jgi:hypothetical protein
MVFLFFLPQVVRILEGENDHFHHLGEHFVPQYGKWRVNGTLHFIWQMVLLFLFFCALMILQIYVVSMAAWNISLWTKILVHCQIILDFGSVTGHVICLSTFHDCNILFLLITAMTRTMAHLIAAGIFFIYFFVLLFSSGCL